MSHREILPIPPVETATDPVHSPADMRQRWRALMGELGFEERRLWIGFVGPDRRMIKTLIEVPLRSRLQPELIDDVMFQLPELLAEDMAGSSVALLLTRPGRGPVSNLDRDWAALLTAAATRYGMGLEPIFRANDEALVEIPPRLRRAG